MSDVSLATPSTDPVVMALTQLELKQQTLITDRDDARNTETAARAAALRLEDELAKTTQALTVLRKLTGRPDVPPAARVPASAPRPGKGHKGIAAAASRELVVLRRIEAGTNTTRALREAIGKPHGATPEQHRVSIQNALSRLYSVRGFITKDGDGWALTAQGRKHLATVKEAP